MCARCFDYVVVLPFAAPNFGSLNYSDSSKQHVVIKKVAVNSGGKHCLALSSDGEVYSWGEAEDAKLGHGNRTPCDRPRVIESLRGKEIIDIAAGGAHRFGMRGMRFQTTAEEKKI